MTSIGKTDYYNDFTHEEQKYLDNATSLTKLLYDMRKVELISSIDNMNIINKTKINEVISYNDEELEKMGNY